MPTHWESSKRPLFVKTVLVDGSRHAILSYEDPLGQNNSGVKNSRPSSPHSSCSTSDHEFHEKKGDDTHKNRAKKKTPRDLQACIVKLQMVLAAQEKKKTVCADQEGKVVRKKNKRKRKLSKAIADKKSCDWHEGETNNVTCNEGSHVVENSHNSFKYDQYHNIAVASFFAANETDSNKLCCSDSKNSCSPRNTAIEDCYKLHPPPVTNLQPNFDVPWNTISAENYFTRPFFNRLSERVLQWLDMANKTKKKNENTSELIEEIHTECIAKEKVKISARNSNRSRNSNLPIRENSEDNADEVRQEEDIDTALSRDFPKFSQELNRLHQLKAEIPEKPQVKTIELQESIARSFTTVVSIRSGKYAHKPKLVADRKSILTRQNKVEEPSDEESEKLAPIVSAGNRPYGLLNISNLKTIDLQASALDRTIETKAAVNKQIFLNPRPLGQLQTRIPWLGDYKSGPFWPAEKSSIKPQLHIFIPTPSEEADNQSDSESAVSDYTVQ